MKRGRRRRLGQNYLVDRDVAEEIVRCLAQAPPRVFEIGPGRGALTAPLLDRFQSVLALELDHVLAEELERELGCDRLEIRTGDALTCSVEDLLAGDAPWQVAANLPYSVGTAILRRLLPLSDLISRMVVMLQKEVALRVVAEPGDRAHGLLALERAAWADAALLFDVSPRAFRPVPKVMSSVIVLDLRAPDVARHALERALTIAAPALTKPRKMLRNAVGPAIRIDHILAAGLDPTVRPGTVSLDGWVALARSLE